MPIFENLKQRVSATFNKQRLYFSKRELEGKLTQAIDIMNGHKEQNLPVGHLYYQMLWKNATAAIADFRNEAKELTDTAPSWADIMLGVPALRELESMATSKPGKDSVMYARVKEMTLGASILIFASCFVYAGWHVLYILLTHNIDKWAAR